MLRMFQKRKFVSVYTNNKFQTRMVYIENKYSCGMAKNTFQEMFMIICCKVFTSWSREYFQNLSFFSVYTISLRKKKGLQ